MKVAQYEVLGWRFKKTIRPGRGRDDRRLLTLLKPCMRGPGAKTLLSSLPGRTFFFALFPSPAAAHARQRKGLRSGLCRSVGG